MLEYKVVIAEGKSQLENILNNMSEDNWIPIEFSWLRLSVRIVFSRPKK